MSPAIADSEIETRRYRVTYDWWELVVDIRQDKVTLAKAREMVLFWDGGDDLLKASAGVNEAFLLHLARNLIRFAVYEDSPADALQEEEGWYKLDGTDGINVVSVDPWDFDEDEFRIGLVGGGQ